MHFYVLFIIQVIPITQYIQRIVFLIIFALKYLCSYAAEFLTLRKHPNKHHLTVGGQEKYLHRKAEFLSEYRFFPLYRCFSFSIENANKARKCMPLHLHNGRPLGFVVHRVFGIIRSSRVFPFIELQSWPPWFMDSKQKK